MASNFSLLEVHDLLTADGELYTLTDGMARWLMNFSGFGMPDVSYNTARGFGQDGVTVVEQHLEERSIRLSLDVEACTRLDWWEERRRLIDILRFNRGGDMWLRHWRENGTLREIGARYVGGATFQPLAPGSRRGFTSFAEDIELVCADPVWYGDSYSYDAALNLVSHWVWPFTSPAGFLSAGRSSRITLTGFIYPGDYKSYPTLEVTGPANSIQFRNDTLGTRVAWIYPLGAAQSITITFSQLGAAYSSPLGVAFETQFAGTLTDDSEPLYTYIAPAPEVPGGVNDLALIVGGATAATAATLSFRDRWQGI